MNPSELTALMHAVLDGEATPGETRELDRILAADPSAKAEFYELQLLFDDLGRIRWRRRSWFGGRRDVAVCRAVGRPLAAYANFSRGRV
jgi:hypothetical protein